MAKKFLFKYFPIVKTTKMRNDISSYAQMESKTLYHTWERFKDLLRRCPHHGLPTYLQVQMFCNGLNQAIRQMIGAVVGGTLNSKTLEAIQELYEEMVLNSYQWNNSWPKPSKPTCVYDVNAVIALAV